MKPRSTQSGTRENTASSRQHAPRSAMRPTPNQSPKPSDISREEARTISASFSQTSSLSSSNNAAHIAATGREREEGTEAHAGLASITTENNQRSAFEPLLDSEEASKLLGNIHIKTLQRYARLGGLPGYRIGGHWYFRASELDSWLRSQLNSSCHPCRLRQEKTDAA